jgi:hypothetical protein
MGSVEAHEKQGVPGTQRVKGKSYFSLKFCKTKKPSCKYFLAGIVSLEIGYSQKSHHFVHDWLVLVR